MILIVRSARFRKKFGNSTIFKIQKKRFQENWRDPRLHVKKVRELEDAFSFRVTRRYRVLFYFQNQDTAVFFDVDHRKDVY